MAEGASDSHKDVKVPIRLLEALRPHLEEMGEQIPGLDRIVPKVNLDLSVREVAMHLGALLKNCGLYRKGQELTLMAMRDGKWKPMTAHRFCGWVEKYVTCYKNYRGKGDKYYEGETSMGKDLAAKILETDDFLEQIPVIEKTVSVRLPVRRVDKTTGKVTVELLKAGYDPDRKLWCDDEVPYATDLTLKQAIEILERYCREFPWADMKEGRWSPGSWQNGNFLVHVSAMLGTFVHLMLPNGTMRPVILYTANDQGSGKSILVAMTLAGPFGIASSTDLPMGKGGLNQEKFTALLETVARSLEPFLFLDDVPGAIFSNALNRFTTAPAHTGRSYGDNSEMFKAPAVTQVFVTGNNVDITRDILQRALICELFLKVDSESVKHSFDMTANWLAEDKQRSEILSALWTMVRIWVDNGMHASTALKHRAPVWSDLVGGILDASIGEGAAGLAFATRDLPFAGDRNTDEMRKLLTAMADDVEIAFDEWIKSADEDEDRPAWTGKSVTTSDIVAKARELDLLVEIVGEADGKPLQKTELKRLGRRIEKWRGKEDLVTSRGRKFRFGRRRQEKGTVYPIEWV